MLVTFPSIVRNLHFDDVEGMIVTGIEGDFAQVVTLTNIPQYVKQIWFDFEYLDAHRGEGQLDPVQNWFDATMTSVNIYWKVENRKFDSCWVRCKIDLFVEIADWRDKFMLRGFQL